MGGAVAMRQFLFLWYARIFLNKSLNIYTALILKRKNDIL